MFSSVLIFGEFFCQPSDVLLKRPYALALVLLMLPIDYWFIGVIPHGVLDVSLSTKNEFSLGVGGIK